jgi:hypothetical protein
MSNIGFMNISFGGLDVEFLYNRHDACRGVIAKDRHAGVKPMS